MHKVPILLIPLEKATKNLKVFDVLKENNILIDIDKVEQYLEVFNKLSSSRPNPNYWSDKRVLITGISGFVGSHFADKSLALEAQVYGFVRRHAVAIHDNIQHAYSKVNLFEGDLTEQRRVEEVIREYSPHVICHYASESFVPTSITEPSRVMFNNSCSTINVLDATRKHDGDIEAILVACSSEQYGNIESLDELPIKESNPFRPCSVYAVSKVCTEYLAKIYNLNYGLPTVITRSFNTEGPRRGLQFFTSFVASQIAKCVRGEEDKIIMGNPNSARDFTHVYDVVNAHMLAVEKAKRSEPYNVCSGIGVRSADYIKLAMRIYRLDRRAKVYVDTERFRPYEQGKVFLDGFIGDYTKLNSATGWSPTLSVVDIIKDGVEYFKCNTRYLHVQATDAQVPSAVSARAHAT